MSRVRNARGFLQKFRELWGGYERDVRPRLDKFRERFAHKPSGKILPDIDEALEAHIRVYYIDALLEALNWLFQGRGANDIDLGNLLPEVPVKSKHSRTTRFLDYLGYEKHNDRPLLIVETKRPSAHLPNIQNPPVDSPNFTTSEHRSDFLSQVISNGVAGAPLTDEWSEWLDSLRDYVCSVHAKTEAVPKRVVLTNGDWLVLFLDPLDSFVDRKVNDPTKILVFENRNAVEERYTELFTHLEYQNVIGKIPLTVKIGELPFYVQGIEIDHLMHGLRLRYFEEPGVYDISPAIRVAPILAVRTMEGVWFCVEKPPKDFKIPHKSEELSNHLDSIQKAALDLLKKTQKMLGTTHKPIALTKHYDGVDGLDGLKGVFEYYRDIFFVITGDKTHYLLPSPSVPDCPFHDWAASNAGAVACHPHPIGTSSINPRSFFESGRLHHCSHSDVWDAKSAQLTPSNRERCGSRSGEDGSAFCEIWSFENHLCCRTCTFEPVCEKAEAFHLPCQRTEILTPC